VSREFAHKLTFRAFRATFTARPTVFRGEKYVIKDFLSVVCIIWNIFFFSSVFISFEIRVEGGGEA
jgi:hypothetical protein